MVFSIEVGQEGNVQTAQVNLPDSSVYSEYILVYIKVAIEEARDRCQRIFRLFTQLPLHTEDDRIHT